VVLLYRYAHAGTNKWALAETSMSQVIKGELPFNPHEGSSVLAVARGVDQYFA